MLLQHIKKTHWQSNPAKAERSCTWCSQGLVMNSCTAFQTPWPNLQIHSLPSPQVSLQALLSLLKHQTTVPHFLPIRPDRISSEPAGICTARPGITCTTARGFGLCCWQEFLWASDAPVPALLHPAVKSEPLEKAHPSSCCVPVRELQPRHGHIQSKQRWSPR